MDKVIRCQQNSVTVWSGQSLRHLCQTILLFVLGLGIAYGSFYLAAYLRWPVSGSLIIQGRWVFNSWLDFPLLDCLGMLVGMVTIPVVWEWRRTNRPREIGFALPSRWILFMALALTAAFAFTFVTRGLAFFAHQKRLLSEIIFFGIYFLCVSVSEEIMFRGVLQRRIRRISNSLIAVGISSVFFFFWHGLPTGWQECFLRMTGAVILGILYDRSKSLYPSIALHWLINMGQLF